MSVAGTYRLTKGGHSRRESAGFRRYARHDEIFLTETEAAQLRGRVELISPSIPTTDAGVNTSTGLGESANKITPPTRSRRTRRS